MEIQGSQHSIQWFRAAVPYIAAHRGRTMVIALAGEAAMDPQFPSLLRDIAQLRALDTRVVLVHGARPQIEARLQEQGAASRYSMGLRVTDSAALRAVCDAVGHLRLQIEALLTRQLGTPSTGGQRIRVASGNFVIARPIGVRSGVDFQWTGEVRRVDVPAMEELLASGQIVLLSPIGYSPTGEIFNLSGEDVATQVAVALQADKLVFLTEAGPLRHPDQSPLTQLTVPAAEKLLQERQDLPPELAAHLRSAIEACSSSRLRVHLIDRHIDGGLPLELFSRMGIGTLVSREPFERIRQATAEDIGGIFNVLQPLEAEGVLIRRSREHLELDIHRYQVLDADGLIIGTAALHLFGDGQAAEIAGLALHPDFRGSGRGNQLLEHMEQQAIQRGARKVFVLTTRTAQWFKEREYREGRLEELPLDRQIRYQQDRKSRIYIKELTDLSSAKRNSHAADGGLR